MFCQVCDKQIQYGDGIPMGRRGEVHRGCIKTVMGAKVVLKPTPGWKEYNVDGYEFSIKADSLGGLKIARPPQL